MATTSEIKKNYCS